MTSPSASSAEHPGFTFTAFTPDVPLAGRARCECGHQATIGDDAHLMIWWRAHLSDPTTPAALLADFLGIR